MGFLVPNFIQNGIVLLKTHINRVQNFWELLCEHLHELFILQIH